MAKSLLAIALFLLYLPSAAQSVTGRIIDAETSESIPYANILIENESLISNEEGFFSIPSGKYGDATLLTISFMGFRSREVSVGEIREQKVVRLTPVAFELQSVDVSKIQQDPYKIMAEVKKNLKKNYKSTETSKNTIFFRESNTFKPSTFDFEITKSTGFSKKSLAEANKQLEAFTSGLVKHGPKSYTDMLLNYYTGVAGSEKPEAAKVDMIKATRLRDENRSASLDDMEKAATNIILQHLDTLKYYRMRSGWIGSRDTISLRKDFNSKKNKKAKRTELTSAKSRIQTFFDEGDFLSSEHLDFVRDFSIYEFTYEGATFLSDNSFVYILNFKPKKNKAIYQGKLYVSDSDFAVLRADYELAKGKRVAGINVKWLLGVKYSENVSKGTMIFKQKQSADDYYLQYASAESGKYVYFNRPFKFIELTDEDKDVVALDFKMEGNMGEKIEMLTISRDEISRTEYENAAEKEFKYIPIKRYDPTLWKDYSAIEPLEEMKAFRVQ